MTSSRPSRALWVKRSALAALSFLLALVLIEVVWRFRSAGFGPTTNPHYVLHDDLLGWRYKPGVRVRHQSSDFDVEVAIGPLGFRDQPSLPTRPPAVLVLGDSMTFGWGVEGDATFSRLLEEELELAVWNLGVSGYGTDQQYLLLRNLPFSAALDFELRPKVVLVVFCSNDLEEVMFDVMYGKSKPLLSRGGEASRELEFRNQPVPFPWLERSSTFYRSLRRHWIERTRPPLTERGSSDGVERIGRLYRAMRKQAERLGATFLVAHQGEPYVTASLTQSGIRGIDLSAALNASTSEGSEVIFDHDPHWNARGHQVVAAVLAKALRPHLEP